MMVRRENDVEVWMMGGGWMCFDGRWKLCKYSTGEHMLFDLIEDPTEERNLLNDGACGGTYLRLDRALTEEIMRSTMASHHDKLVYDVDLSGDVDFGRSGWQRTYPKPL